MPVDRHPQTEPTSYAVRSGRACVNVVRTLTPYGGDDCGWFLTIHNGSSLNLVYYSTKREWATSLEAIEAAERLVRAIDAYETAHDAACRALQAVADETLQHSPYEQAAS